VDRIGDDDAVREAMTAMETAVKDALGIPLGVADKTNDLTVRPSDDAAPAADGPSSGATAKKLEATLQAATAKIRGLVHAIGPKIAMPIELDVSTVDSLFVNVVRGFHTVGPEEALVRLACTLLRDRFKFCNAGRCWYTCPETNVWQEAGASCHRLAQAIKERVPAAARALAGDRKAILMRLGPKDYELLGPHATAEKILACFVGVVRGASKASVRSNVETVAPGFLEDDFGAKLDTIRTAGGLLSFTNGCIDLSLVACDRAPVLQPHQ
jgi:hypothetical protein